MNPKFVHWILMWAVQHSEGVLEGVSSPSLIAGAGHNWAVGAGCCLLREGCWEGAALGEILEQVQTSSSR